MIVGKLYIKRCPTCAGDCSAFYVSLFRHAGDDIDDWREYNIISFNKSIQPKLRELPRGGELVLDLYTII